MPSSSALLTLLLRDVPSWCGALGKTLLRGDTLKAKGKVLCAPAGSLRKGAVFIGVSLLLPYCVERPKSLPRPPCVSSFLACLRVWGERCSQPLFAHQAFPSPFAPP